MSRTLLLGDASSSWREWLRANGRGRDVVLLDSADGSHGPPCRFLRLQEGKVVDWAFAGSLDPTRDPIRTLNEAARAIADSGPDLIVQSFAYRATPVGRHLTLAVAHLARPSEIVVADTLALDLRGWPVGPQTTSVDAGYPDLVQQAQRRARWIELLDSCVEHEIDLRHVAIQGARLGSGLPVDLRGIDAIVHAELAGSSLFLVADRALSEGEIAQAIALTHAARAHVVEPESYDGLLVSLARQDAEDFALGVIRSIDFRRGILSVRSPAVAPAPVRILKFGGLRLDSGGKELGEVKPWSL